MRVRQAVRPPVTWAFLNATPEDRRLCNFCKLKDQQHSCPRMIILDRTQRRDTVAVRCKFFDDNRSNEREPYNPE